jgi:hypothetical protein
MNRYKLTLLQLGACLAITLPTIFVSANASFQADEIKQCRAMQDDAERLACLDNLFKALDKEQEKKALIETPTVESSEKTNVAANSEMDDIDKRAQALMNKGKRSDDPFSSNTPRISGKPEPDRVESDNSFGAESLTDSRPKTEDSIQTSIASMKEDNRGYATFILDNGQVWRQTESARLIFKEGETITIKKGVFKSFYLSKPNNNRSVRVKRIQ